LEAREVVGDNHTTSDFDGFDDDDLDKTAQ